MNTKHLQNVKKAAERLGLYKVEDFRYIVENVGIMGDLRAEYVEKTLTVKREIEPQLLRLANEKQKKLIAGLTPFSLWRRAEAKKAASSTKDLLSFLENFELYYLLDMTKPEPVKAEVLELPDPFEEYDPCDDFENDIVTVTRNGVSYSEKRW
jgi:hypothetical protein